MNKKSLLISLTMPFFMCANNGVDDRIKELNDLRFQKELELSELGAKIAEKQKLIEEMYHDECSLFTEKVESSKLEGQDLENFIQAWHTASKEFESLLNQAINTKKVVKGFLLRELISGEKFCPNDFNASKFWILRGTCEHDLLEMLIMRYEVGLQELIEIDKEIAALQGKTIQN